MANFQLVPLIACFTWACRQFNFNGNFFGWGSSYNRQEIHAYSSTLRKSSESLVLLKGYS